MSEEDYEQDFEDEDAGDEQASSTPAANSQPASQRSKIQSERKLSGHPIVRVLKNLSKQHAKQRWPSQSTKGISADDFQVEQPASVRPLVSEEELKRSIFQLQIRIKSMQKQLQEREEALQKDQLDSIKATQNSMQSTKIRKRAFSREEQLKYLIAKYHDFKTELQQQNSKMLQLHNREMELQSDQYLLDLTKQVEHYQQYIKKLQKYVHKERLLAEKNLEPPAKLIKRVAISDKSVQEVLLHTQLNLEKLEERENDLDERVAELQESNKYLDEKLEQLQEKYEQRQTQKSQEQEDSNKRLQIKQLLHRRTVEEKHLKTIKASIRGKMLVSSSQCDDLVKQNKELDRRLAEQRANNHSLLERLKQQTEVCTNSEVNNLAAYLLSKLEQFDDIRGSKKLKSQRTQVQQPEQHDLADSRATTIDQDQSFTSGVIKLKRRLANLKAKREEPSFGQLYAADSSHLITQFPSLVGFRSGSHQNTPRTTRRRTSSQLSVTTNDEQQHSSKYVRFSYW